MTDTTATLSRDDMKAMDIENLLEVSVSQIAEVKEFNLFPTGAYSLQCLSCDVAEGTETNGAHIMTTFKVVEVQELENAEDAAEAPEEGEEFRARYYPGYGFENFKTTFSDICESLPLGIDSSLREMMEAMPSTNWEGMIEKKTFKDKDTSEIKHNNKLATHTVVLL